MKLSTEQINLLLDESKNHRCEPYDCCVQLVGIADLPSQFGEFQICALVSPCDGKEHTAIIKGDIVNKENVLVRVHSECLTGDVMGSKRCDCREQLLESLKRIQEEGQGALLYLRQEGRNIGLTEKIKAYALQDKGLDTIEANVALGWQPDQRDYGVAAHILRTLGMTSIRLLTNNPDKVRQLSNHGIIITERVPLIIETNEYNQAYLETKAQKTGHLLGDKAKVVDVTEVLSHSSDSIDK
ncbi:MAG: GTP cyclohydrolase II [Candidatus Thorarchaeota archaeon]|nr:GTP cyclohydrolase II [Candidatus Thorarchaeota archaeon]